MPDDHYCCKICGQLNCVCPPVTQHLGVTDHVRAARGQIEMMKGYRPTAFVRDFNEISVTWKFSNNQEADDFALSVSKLMKGKL